MQSRAYDASPIRQKETTHRQREQSSSDRFLPIHRSYDVLDMQAEHLEALFHHEIDPLDEIALAIRRKRQIEGFMLVWL